MFNKLIEPKCGLLIEKRRIFSSFFCLYPNRKKPLCGASKIIKE
jgi:hypothetical protein